MRVRLDGVLGAAGDVVAGVLYRGDFPTALRVANAVGGFGVELDGGPLAVVATVRDRSPIDHIPLMDGPAALVPPGDYTLMMWRGPTLTGYSRWVPASEAGLTVCPVDVTVGEDEAMTLRVTGFPRQPQPLDLRTMKACRQ